jgi:hypothetical protein
MESFFHILELGGIPVITMEGALVDSQEPDTVGWLQANRSGISQCGSADLPFAALNQQKMPGQLTCR